MIEKLDVRIDRLLEVGFTMPLVNARTSSTHVPGRKTDTIDAAWLAQPLAHGLGCGPPSCRRRSASCGT